LALVIGLVVVNLVRPGEGMNIDANHIDASAITGYTRAAASHGGTVAFLLDIIPGTMIGAFANGAMLQVILIALLCGIALVQLGDKAKPLVEVIDASLHMLFRIVGMVMRLAPLGAGAGVAYTLGRHGVGTLWSLGYLMLSGELPYSGDTVQQISERRAEGRHRPLRLAAPDAPRDMIEAIERCLQPLPDDRFRHARELHAALTARQTPGSRIWRRLNKVRVAARKVVTFILEATRVELPRPVRG